MRLLVISNLFTPDRGGGASVFTDMCVGLQERGWEVTVFTTHPYYPEWRRKSDASPWRIQEERVDGVRVLRHGIHVPTNPSRLSGRLLYEASFGASLMRSLFRGRFDVTMVYCPMIGAVGFAGLRKMLGGGPLWLNIQDIPADAAAASGISRSGVFNRFSEWLQAALFNRADVWSTISPVMVERLEPLRRRGQPLHLCPNWLNGSLAECVGALPSKEGRTPAGPIRLLYAGNIGKKQGLVDFCEQLKRVPSDFHFRIHGNGGEAETVRRWVESGGDPRFEFGEFLDERGFAGALHATDLFVISEKAGSGASFIPSKLIPGIASGTPVLAVCDRSGPLGREMSEAGLGPLLEWSSMDDLPKVIAEAGRDGGRFVEWQANCLRHARQYHRDHAIGRFDDLLRSLARSGGRAEPNRD